MPALASRPCLHAFVYFALCCAVVIGSICGAVTTQAAELPSFEKQIQPLLAKYCLECHGPKAQEGELRFDQLSRSFDPSVTAKWRQAVDRVELNQMPPEGKPRPSADERRLLVSWVDGESQRAELARRAKEGRVVLRRLNRVEYENTIRDLLGIQVNLREQLPEDGSANGFDNAGAALHTSSFLMEKYLEAADTALNMAIANRPKPPPMIEQHEGLKDPRPGNERKRLSLSGRHGGLLLLVAVAQRPSRRVLSAGSAATIASASPPRPFKVRASRSRFA